jgi:hypothetical protein
MALKINEKLFTKNEVNVDFITKSVEQLDMK